TGPAKDVSLETLTPVLAACSNVGAVRFSTRRRAMSASIKLGTPFSWVATPAEGYLRPGPIVSSSSGAAFLFGATDLDVQTRDSVYIASTDLHIPKKKADGLSFVPSPVMQNVTSVIISSSPPAAPVSIQLQDAAKLQVTWLNVLAGFSLLLLDIVASSYFKLGLSKDLLIAAARCVAQLTLLGTILRSVFNAQSPVAVAALSLSMLLLGANEVTFNRAKRRTKGLFLSTAVSLVISVVPVAVIGANLAIVKRPFWGMLAGSAIGGSAVAVNYVTREVVENRDKLETYLAHGASRAEACLPLASEAVKIALLPTINQMSVVGLIAIPGMMTGAILGGADVAQAARMQMIIMFLISACTTLCVSCSVFLVMQILVDEHHRIRLDRISKKPLWPAIILAGVKTMVTNALVKARETWTGRGRGVYTLLDR
ncbi:MAG: hypothetical protein CYPHOPRED_004844, partial [Cyphobasidiales sp. Tagirdzhanova-0007]